MQEITQHAYETQMSADHFERTEKDTKKNIYITEYTWNFQQ